MRAKKIVKGVYKTIRSILFSLTLIVVGLYVVAYTLLSIPSFTNKVKDIATQQISQFLGGEVKIDEFKIYPFNEARILGLQVFDIEGNECLYVEKIGAGISIWELLSNGKIDLTFGEIIGLNATIIQVNEGDPLNIDFIIKAFTKNEKKEQKPFALSLRNVVLRKSKMNFKRPWLQGKHIGEIDLSNLYVSNLAADISFPRISDKGIDVDLRRLSLLFENKITINKLAFKGSFSRDYLITKDFELEFPKSRLQLSDIELLFEEEENFKSIIRNKPHSIEITGSYITPSEFTFIIPQLAPFVEKLDIDLQAHGNLSEVTVDRLNFGNQETLYLSLRADLNRLDDMKNFKVDVENLQLKVNHTVFQHLANSFSQISAVSDNLISKIGNVDLTADFSGDFGKKWLDGSLHFLSDLVLLEWKGNISALKGLVIEGKCQAKLQDLNLQNLLPNLHFGNINADLVAEGKYSSVNPEGDVNLSVEDFEYKGKIYDGFSLNLNKSGEFIQGYLSMNNQIANMEASFNGDISGEDKMAKLELNLQMLDLSEVTDMKKYQDYLISGNLSLDAYGKSFDDIVGNLELQDFSFASPNNEKVLKLNNLHGTASLSEDIHTIEIESDWLDFRAEGIFKFKEIPLQIKELLASVFPELIPPAENHPDYYASNVNFDLLIKKNNSVPDFFKLPVRLLTPINIEGTLDGENNLATLTVDVPYLQQGKDKLIYDSRIVADIDANNGILNTLITTTMPVKKGDLALNLILYGQNNTLTSEIHWINTENPDFKGLLTLNTEFLKNSFTQKPEILTEIQPSVMRMGPKEWNINRSHINYFDKKIEIKDFKIWHNEQMVQIDGKASPEYQDAVRIYLADIDVDYIFDMLQINYVTFGGIATGEIEGRSLLSGNPVAETEGLRIKEFTYNGAKLGECFASSKWNNDQKQIEIGADIFKDGRQIVKGAGGIWLGRDSLSFDLHAMKTPVEFVQPFMSAFSSEVGGFATGDVKLFGTFHDIDMTGVVFADSIAVKVDFTNTVYHGSDSVIFNPGLIEIPHFTLYDKFGNSAIFSGELAHRYFHDPSFTFRLSDARNLLCYDTNSDLNPDWYGTLFGSGSALIHGIPALVDISADMTVAGNSNFNFVLNETQYAQDYPFLTFSDKRKIVEDKKNELSPLDFKAMLKKNMQQEENVPSHFTIDIRASITPQVLFTLVMDPAAGDKITARGKGAMQVKYESDDDQMAMYGKYEIDEGNYNFSLQDIILRDFKIKDGSSISFNGNPLSANLDISATYRVNTNLTDLDKSFSTDRDLNRTNVPVDAVLIVTGDMQQPDITFDIELPTLTQDVERKVKSIISTDDMMNRQIIYLLALNRFYTPEYMGSSSNGGELAAVASSTISSQLSNMLGQLTDKFSVSPSFRSDKGDFSDIEVDVALSSKLLNNRLLINGNFGYRDRSNSSTTFVGDFDVEYLLSKNGNLRLKAYNHFNDQNYYLREALTTQGLGVVYRRDFDDWFTFLKKKRKNAKIKVKEEEEVESNPEDFQNKQEEILKDGTEVR